MLGAEQDLRLRAELVLVMAHVEQRKAIAFPDMLREQMLKYVVA